MYREDDKRILYWLIEQYLSNNMNEINFCREFYAIFTNKIDMDSLTDVEYNIFSDLFDTVARFSPYDEDRKLWSGFISAEKLKQKIIEAKTKLSTGHKLI